MERYGVITRLPPDIPLALMDIGIGLVYVLSSPIRSSAAAFTVAKRVMQPLADLLGADPIRLWGAYFALVGLTLLLLVWMHRRRSPQFSTVAWLVRVFAPALFVMWAIMLILSAVTDRRAAFAGVPVYLYLAYRHTFTPLPPRGDD